MNQGREVEPSLSTVVGTAPHLWEALKERETHFHAYSQSKCPRMLPQLARTAGEPPVLRDVRIEGVIPIHNHKVTDRNFKEECLLRGEIPSGTLRREPHTNYYE